jgi:hypothetical protein
MNLFEFYERAPEGYQDLSQDNSQPKWGEGRKAKLTLGEINKIRRMSEVRNYERASNLKKIRAQYKPPAQPAL